MFTFISSQCLKSFMWNFNLESFAWLPQYMFVLHIFPKSTVAAARAKCVPFSRKVTNRRNRPSLKADLCNECSVSLKSLFYLVFAEQTFSSHLFQFYNIVTFRSHLLYSLSSLQLLLCLSLLPPSLHPTL